MSYHEYDYDAGGRYGSGSIPQYSSHHQPPRQYYPSQQSQSRQMLPSQSRRGPPPPMGAGYGSNTSRGPPPRPQRTPPPPVPYDDNLYDGSAYGDEYGYYPDEQQSDSWPLPAAPPPRSHVPPPPINSSPRRSSNDSPRRAPPQRPQRPDYVEPVRDPPRAKIAAGNQQYRQQAPPPPSHHGSGQWTGDGYSSSPAAAAATTYLQPGTYQPQQGPLVNQAAKQQQQQQQQIYQQRPPLGPPPSARRGPASYYPQVGPVHPIAEETDSMRGSIKDARSLRRGHASSVYSAEPGEAADADGAGRASVRSFATQSSNAIPIGIADHYLSSEERIRGSGVPSAVAGADRSLSHPLYEDDERDDESPIDPSVIGTGGERNESPMSVSRDEPSPEPATLVRQASYGKRGQGKLTEVKSGERMRDMGGEGRGGLPSQRRDVTDSKNATAPTVPAKDVDSDRDAGTRPSAETDESLSFEKSRQDDKALEAGGVAAMAGAAFAASRLGNQDSKDRLSSTLR